MKTLRKKVEKVITVKSFLPEIDGYSESVLYAIVDEACDGNMKKVYSVMSDTTSMNSGKKTGINNKKKFETIYITDRKPFFNAAQIILSIAIEGLLHLNPRLQNENTTRLQNTK